MTLLGPHNAVYLGDGDWIPFEEFGDEGDFDLDEERYAHLPLLEWQADMQRRYPEAELAVIRQFIRLSRAAAEYRETTNRHLPVYGALGELYASMAWGVRLHWKHNAEGSDGKIGNDFVEVKTIGPLSTTDKVQVKLSGHFSKLIVVKIDFSEDTGGLKLQSRLVTRRDLTTAKAGCARIAWSRACEIGEAEPKG
jgi:hypothetical protein